MTQLPETEKWLSLSAAAKELGVHHTTLRRWADNGEIPVMLTPGGHRRFSTAVISQFSQQHLNLSATSIETTWADQALVQTRQEIVVQKNQPWLTSFDDAARSQYRILGQQLLGLTMQYLSDENGGEILAEAANIGHKYGDIGLQAGLPLTEALEASMFFRDMLMETALQLPENTRIKPDANIRLLRRVNTLLNTVQLAIAEVYDVSSSDSLSGA
ncbi:MAG: helix-turn-helix domain-containing protein [Anaerolineae bacterium]|nr:helix-turn-helix domain-containing protein [Anaerolineae bacterium]